jgi:hypothetical protein
MMLCSSAKEMQRLNSHKAMSSGQRMLIIKRQKFNKKRNERSKLRYSKGDVNEDK